MFHFHCHFANKPNDFADFFKVVKSGSLAEIEDAIEAGADVNAKYKDDWTPQHYAARFNPNSFVLAALIKGGADVNAKENKYGETPLHFAVEVPVHEWFDFIAPLIEAGADVNAKNNDGKTSLHYAARSNLNPEVIVTLIKAGADVNAKDKDDMTPLHYATLFNLNFSVAAALIEAGADVNVEEKQYGKTPLHFATENEWCDFTAELIKAGADVNATTDTGETPLKIALDKKRTSTVETLHAAGAK